MSARGKVSVKVSKPVAVAATLREGEAAQRRGDTAAAEAAFRRVIAAAPDHAGALQRLGIIEAKRGRPAQAEALFARAAAASPDDHNIHNSRANALCALRRYDEAVQSFVRAIELNPAYPEAHANFGRALIEQGKPKEALAQFDAALALRPESSEVLFQRALALVAMGRQEDAVTALERVLVLRPGHAEAHFNRGNLLRQQGRTMDALISFERAIAANPDMAEAHCNRGNALLTLTQLADALASVDRAIALKPDLAAAHCIRGDVLARLERLPEALEAVERAITLQPDLAEAHNNRGVALRQLGRLDKALAGFDKAIALRPTYAGAHANRAVALLELGRAAEALEAIGAAIRLEPGRADCHNIHGNILQDLHRHDDALRAYAQSRALQPDYPEAEWNESVCRLLHGDFAGGWPLFESRWRNGQMLGEIKLAQPLWDGRKVEGTLLAWGEQGIGDQVQQLGMADRLAGCASRVVIAVTERLVPLVSRSFPQQRVIGLKAALREPCAVQLPMGSLGGHFRRDWKEFPQTRPAYLKADPQRMRAMAQALPGKARLTCGLSWRSIAPKVGKAKSMALRDLAPLLQLDGVRFVDLQYGDTATERRQVQEELGVAVTHLDALDSRNDLDGLAALIAACDVVVTISNTTAHLAGALGRPTLLMLPFGVARHWYWHEGRDDSPWYPSMRLYRQPAAGQWAPVFDAVRDAVKARLPQRRK
jgi:tetratricopeptide (TPR) repeat protein